MAAKKPPPKKKVAKRKVAKKKVVKKKAARGKGRPTVYKKEYAHMAQVACKLGATDDQLAELFQVTKRTINRWKKDHPDDFCHSLKMGKAEADENVKDALYSRATGYSHPDVHISNYMGNIIATPITKHYPPDTTACIFWLKNRDPENWRDKPEGEGAADDIAEAFLKLAQVLPD